MSIGMLVLPEHVKVIRRVLKKGEKAPKFNPWYDYKHGFKVKPGQKVPKGYATLTITQEDLPSGKSRYACQCGCGLTYRLGDVMAVKNATATFYMNRHGHLIQPNSSKPYPPIRINAITVRGGYLFNV